MSGKWLLIIKITDKIMKRHYYPNGEYSTKGQKINVYLSLKELLKPKELEIRKKINEILQAYVKKNNNKMEKNEFLKKYNLTEAQFNGSEKIGGSLYLRSLTSIPEGFNPTVGGSLDLRSLTSIPAGFNPTVGWDLDIKGGISNQYTPLNNAIISWKDGKYISADGMFTEVICKKGNVYKVKKLNEYKEFYLVTDGLRHAHGDSIQDAKADLIYKLSNDANIEKYKGMKKDSVLSFADAIECYRVITGACALGVKDFIQSKGIEDRSYFIAEIIELTKGRYMYETFANFFK